MIYRVLTDSAQLLQTQTHVMQSIQDQQNTLIGAILPLVPILHGVPPQMDQIKTALSDMVANAVSTMTSSVESAQSTLVSEFAHGHGRVQSSTRVGSLNKSMSGSRRKRSNASVLGPQEISVPLSSPLDSRGHGEHHLNLKRARIEGAVHHVGDAQLPRKLSRIAVPPTNSSDPRPLLQTPQTPRQPLADLLLPPGSNTSRVQHHTGSRMNSMSREYMRRLEILRAAGGSSTPIPRPLEHARPDMQDPAVTRRRSAASHDRPFAVDNSAMGLPSASDQDVLSKAVKIEEILEPNLTGVFSIHSSPLSSPPLSPQHDPSINPTQQLRENMTDAAQVEHVQVPITSNTEPKSMSLRDRRAQISRVR